MRRGAFRHVIVVVAAGGCALPAATVDERSNATAGSGGADVGPPDTGKSSTGGGGHGGSGPDASTGGNGGAPLDGGRDSDGQAGTDGGGDVASDAERDAYVDASPDWGSDGSIEAGADASTDTLADVGPDASADDAAEAAPDAGPDSGVEAGPDGSTDSSDAGTDGGVVRAWPDSPTPLCTNDGTTVVTCASAMIGQDGTYAINTPTYSTASGVVTDSKTLLAWQDVPSAGMDYAAATTYCNTQTTGGRTWRLPSFLEVLSIADFGRVDPATLVGQTNGPLFFWVSDVAYDASKAWTLLSSSGQMATVAKTSTFLRVRCVSGAPFTGGFVRQTDGTVLDERTGLVWGPDRAPLTWAQALAHCESYTLGTHGDFRLPSVKELETLIVAPSASPAYDAVAFTDVPSMAYYASSTPYAGMPSSYWVVQPDTGAMNNLWVIASQTARVRCVRSQ